MLDTILDSVSAPDVVVGEFSENFPWGRKISRWGVPQRATRTQRTAEFNFQKRRFSAALFRTMVKETGRRVGSGTAFRTGRESCENGQAKKMKKAKSILPFSFF